MRRADGWLSPAFAATGLLLVVSLLFGGASRENAWQVALIELFALALLPFAVLRVSRSTSIVRDRLTLILPVALMAIVALQLLPLPPDLWNGMRGHEETAGVLKAWGLADGWRPLSMTPDLTFGSLLALIPPLTLFLLVWTLGSEDRARLALLVLIVAGISLVLGAGQIMTGQDSPLYLYTETNRGFAVGLFANRNHQATLLLAAVPLFIGWALARRVSSTNRRLVLLIGCVAAVIIVAAAIVMVRSRAGALFAGPVLLGAALVAVRSGVFGRVPRKLLFAGLGVIGLAIVGMIFGARSILERLQASPEVDLRLSIAPIAWDISAAFAPFGSGFGSFEAMYRATEPIQKIGSRFVNQAHNDYLQIWMEGGVPAVVVLIAFLVWWGRASVRAWKGSSQSATMSLARTGTIVVALAMAHSIVDYPLRTLTWAAVFALACGFIAPLQPTASQRATSSDPGRTPSRRDGARGRRTRSRS